MVTTNKDYEIKFETVDKLEDGNYHLLEWTVPSLGATRDEAIFNVSKFEHQNLNAKSRIMLLIQKNIGTNFSD